MTFIAFLLAGLFVGVCVGYWYARHKSPPTVHVSPPTVYVDFAILNAALEHQGMIAIRKEMLSSLVPTRH